MTTLRKSCRLMATKTLTVMHPLPMKIRWGCGLKVSVIRNLSSLTRVVLRKTAMRKMMMTMIILIRSTYIRLLRLTDLPHSTLI